MYVTRQVNWVDPVSVVEKTQCPPCEMGKLTVRFCRSSMTPARPGFEVGTRVLFSGVSPLGIWIDTVLLLVAVAAFDCNSKVRIPPAGTVCRRVPCRMSLLLADSKPLKIIGPIIFPSSYDGWVAIHIFRSAGDNTDLSELKSRMSELVASLRRRRRFCLIVTFPVLPSTQ